MGATSFLNPKVTKKLGGVTAGLVAGRISGGGIPWAQNLVCG
jgi:hypothetical protein